MSLADPVREVFGLGNGSQTCVARSELLIASSVGSLLSLPLGFQPHSGQKFKGGKNFKTLAVTQWVKNPSDNAGDAGSIPGWRRSL